MTSTIVIKEVDGDFTAEVEGKTSDLVQMLAFALANLLATSHKKYKHPVADVLEIADDFAKMVKDRVKEQCNAKETKEEIKEEETKQTEA